MNDPAFDSHRGHLALAWQCLSEAPFEVGAARFIAKLRAHVQAHGQAAKYHATLTWAFLALLAERMEAAPGLSFDALMERCPELLESGLVKQHYPRGELESERARAVFVLPRSERQPASVTARSSETNRL